MVTVEMIHYKYEDEDCAEFFDTIEEADSFINDMINNSTCYYIYALINHDEVLRIFCDTGLNKYRSDTEKIMTQYLKRMP